MNYSIALEMANGAGAVLAITLAVTLSIFLAYQIREQSWRVISLTIAMIMVKVGLALNLGYRWLVARCNNRGGECIQFEDDYYLLFVSIIIIAIGGLMILRVLSRPDRRPWSWLGAIVVSVVVPSIYYAFDLLFPTDRPAGELVHGFYHMDRVALSIGIAILGSYTALEIARIALMVNRARIAWLGAAAVVMGGSIWAMHFIAMLAYDLPGVVVSYDLQITALSLAIPIALTLVGFLAAMNADRRALSIVLSGLLIGVGVVAMHYTGMAAMEMPGTIAVFNLYWVGASVVVAMAGSVTAVYLAFVETTFWERIVGAVVMGLCGISGLHYTAMVAFNCYRLPGAVTTVDPGLSQAELAVIVASITGAILLSFLPIITIYRVLEHDV